MSDYRINIIVEGRDNASGALNGVHGSLGRIAEFALGGLVASGLAAIGRGIGDIAREAFSGATGLQNLTVALETLAARELVAAGAAENVQDGLAAAAPIAQNLMRQLRDLSLTSPFQAEQIQDAFRFQMAFGATSDSAIELTGAILDTGSALGLNNTQLDRMSYNLAQALQMGDLTAANLRQLKMVGLDLSDVFRDQLGMSVKDVSGALKDGSLTMADVSSAFVRYADENFGGASERMSRTFQGLQSSFKDLLYYGGADLLTPALESISGALGGVFDWARGLLESGALAGIGEQLGGFVDRVIGFIQGVGEGGIAALFPPEVVANVQAFVDGLRPVGEIITGEIWPAIVGFLPTLQLWGEQLLTLASSALPLFAQAWQFVADNWEVWMVLMGAMVVLILAVEAPIALVIAALAALYLAWVNDWGGIRTFVEGVVTELGAMWTGTLLPALQMVGGFIQTSVVPVFQTVAGVISTVVVTAIAVLSAAWQNILYPALQMVWGFIQNSVVPLFQALANVASAVVGVAVQALAGLWQNVLHPALSAVWGMVQNNIVPVFQKVATLISDTVGPALRVLGEKILPPIQGAFDAISGAVQAVVKWLGQLASKINDIKLPDWLTPGSPTPFELGLWGIEGALRDVTAGMQGLGDVAGGMGGFGGGGGGGRMVVVAPIMIEDVGQYRDAAGQWNYEAIVELIGV